MTIHRIKRCDRSTEEGQLITMGLFYHALFLVIIDLIIFSIMSPILCTTTTLLLLFFTPTFS